MKMSFFGKLQLAWQCQNEKKIDVNPDQLLKTARFERRMDFWMDLVVILILVFVGVSTLSRMQHINHGWPWLIYTGCIAWVVGFMFFFQLKRRFNSARYDEPLLVHVECAIRDREIRIWQDSYTFWWYTLPIALGCMVPPIITFILDFQTRHDWGALFGLLVVEAIFVAVFIFAHVVITRGLRAASEARRKELKALQELRENLLNAELPK
jgi:hypothetical protein